MTGDQPRTDRFTGGPGGPWLTPTRLLAIAAGALMALSLAVPATSQVAEEEAPQELAGTPVPVDQLFTPPGVEGEVVAGNFSFLTGIDWDAQGNMYVSEVGFTEAGPRIFKITPDGNRTSLNLTGANLTPQLLDITIHEGDLYFTTTGRVHKLNLTTEEAETIIAGLPAFGDHRTDEIVFGPDGRLYVSQGTVTNSGVMGLDQAGVPNAINSVAIERPFYRDIPCENVTATGVNYNTINPYTQNVTLNAMQGAAEDAEPVFLNEGAVPAEATGREGERITTGPFAPLGDPVARNETIPGQTKCNGAVLSANPDGSDLQVEAWGFRNPFGIKFDDQGNLLVSDNGVDNRGSRPIGVTPEEINVVNSTALENETPPWYGWPEYSVGLPVTDPMFSSLFPGVGPVLPIIEDPSAPVEPMTYTSDHGSSNKFDIAPNGTAWEGDIFIAEFGTLNIEFLRGALTGMDVAHVDSETGRVTQFIYPAGEARYDGRFRPVEVAFGPDDRMYVVEFGPWIIQPGPGNATHGPAIENVFRPGTARVLAFDLPAESEFQGRPVGNPGGDGTEATNVQVDPPFPPENATEVRAFEYGYAPGEVTVEVGEPVLFRNIGNEGHTVTNQNRSFDSGFNFGPNATVVWTPQNTGTFQVYCQPHPVMQMTIHVVEPGEAPEEAAPPANATNLTNGTLTENVTPVENQTPLENATNVTNATNATNGTNASLDIDNETAGES